MDWFWGFCLFVYLFFLVYPDMLFIYAQWDSFRTRRAVVLIASGLRVIKRSLVSHIIRGPWNSSFPLLCLDIVWENNTNQVLQPTIFLSAQVGFILVLKPDCTEYQCLLATDWGLYLYSFSSWEQEMRKYILFILYYKKKCSGWAAGEARTQIVTHGRQKVCLSEDKHLIHFQLEAGHAIIQSVVQNVTWPLNLESNTLILNPWLCGCPLISVLVERTRIKHQSHWNYLGLNSIDLIMISWICHLHWCWNTPHHALIRRIF